MEQMEVKLSEESLLRLGNIIAEKILFAKKQPEPWIGIEELSKIIHRSVGSIYHDVERKNLPHTRGKRLQFKLSEVETWLRSRS